MAKKILRDTSPEYTEKLIADFKSFLALKSEERLQLNDNLTCNFPFSFGENLFDDRKAILHFTPKAYAKMYALVINYNTEVQWHGIVTRTAEREFLVEDIITFPHEVSETTVTSDQGEYNEWLDSLSDDIFNKVRLHGHSHVSMGCTPSAVDTSYQKRMLNLLESPNEHTDVYYIFLIVNKRGEITVSIYDLQYNALYSTSDVTIKVEFDDRETLEDFIDETRKKVTIPPTRASDKKETKGKPNGSKSRQPAISLPGGEDGYGGSYEDWDDAYFARWARRNY